MLIYLFYELEDHCSLIFFFFLNYVEYVLRTKGLTVLSEMSKFGPLEEESSEAH